MEDINISESIRYIGANDKEIRLFENQYDVPNGMSYNSYLIKDEKNVVMDTVDESVTNQWLNNLESELDGKNVDYLVVLHMEPDHGSNVKVLANKYPDMKIVGNATTFKFIEQFFNIDDLDKRKVIVKEGDTLNIGKHELTFVMAPMVHWPEVMVAYEKEEKVLFAADAFGKFGTLDTDEDWTCEARRYYFNIVGKYGMQVQALLKKAATLDIKTICPLHGPILKDNLEYYLDKYNTWSNYDVESEGVVVAYASIHNNTKEVAKKVAKILEEKNAPKVILVDLVYYDMAEAVEEAFRYGKIILAASSYNGGVFTPMEVFLNHLLHRNFQKRTIGIIENGTWAPSAAKTMFDTIAKMKDINVCENVVTIKSTLKENDIPYLEALVDEILNK